MKGYAYITSYGYDPEKGRSIKDPYLGNKPTLGACMPNIRRKVVAGDHIFVISGKVEGVRQYMIGGFEVDEKMHANVAYRKFPEHRLRIEDGLIRGNIIVTSNGKQHPLDTHGSFERRIENYIVGRNPLVLTAPHEIARGREETLEILQMVLNKRGAAPIRVIGRWSRLEEEQVLALRNWLSAVKAGV